MILAQIGPFTAVLEAAATAVAAGVLLGSVALGVFGLLTGWSRREIERRALTDGYAGGAVGALVAFVDFVVRYGGMK
jgi:hypothetical protein